MRKVSALFVVLVTMLGIVGVAWAATPGVSKDEIKIGVTYPDLDAIRDVTDISHGDYEGSYHAVIDELNKKGGVNGRKLVPVFAKVNPLGTAPAQEACLKLTEDEQVFAAVGFFYFDAPACYVAQHDTPIGARLERLDQCGLQSIQAHAFASDLDLMIRRHRDHHARRRCPRTLRAREIDGRSLLHHRRTRHHEDDQQDEEQIGQRCDVDLRDDRFFALRISEIERHGEAPPARVVRCVIG